MPEMVNENFLDLLIKELSGNINPDEKAVLEDLLVQDDIYKQLYKAFKAYWKTKDTECFDNAQSFQKIKARINQIESANEKPKLYILNKPVFWRSIAAALIPLACWGIYYRKIITSKDDRSAIVWHQKQTGSGSKSTIVLGDGTRIILNAKSCLKFPSAFEGKTREVYLIGEAFFDVHKDHQHPFIIHTGKMNVRVLGTAFDVKAYPNDVLSETTLIRGSVEVTLADRPSDHIILKPKEKLVVNNSDGNKDKVTPQLNKAKPKVINSINNTQYTLTTLTYLNNNDTTSVETSWVQNKLVFKNKAFIDLAEQMERWYGYRIQFNNDSLKDLRFTASFEKETVKQALDALRLTDNFHYKIDKSIIYIF